MHLCIVYAILMHNMQVFKMIKQERQNRIIDLIEENDIETQEDLTAMLEESGFHVNQSSVSRDIAELGIIKINGFYTLPNRESGPNIFGLKSVEPAGENLIVAKCALGMASAACVKLDDARIDEIVGTIAGEDTIFIAVKDAKAQKIAIKKVWEIFEN